ncbi:MAG: diaminopimelate epimerase [Epsilonproteobacteria bacterium]|nr:diaminopimelate epimerase [Campylobacterota bacterium]
MVLDSFVKYHSLGNDFVIFDWFKKPRFYLNAILRDSKWPEFVRRVCQRNTGVGADCVLLIVSSEQTREPELLIYNADGSFAQNCSNGVRCVAHYLHMQRSFPEQFSVAMNGRNVVCTINKTNVPDGDIQVTTNLGNVLYKKEHTVLCADKKLQGHVLSVGNPHFVVLEKIKPSWLEKYGYSIENHESFEQGTNVEFAWQHGDSGHYQLIVHERGCGMTQACGSGASAVLALLYFLKKIAYDQKTVVIMPGGEVIGWMSHNEDVILQASVEFVFSGVLQKGEL